MCLWFWSLITTSLMTMKDIVSKFSGKFAITEEEQEVIVIDKQEVDSLKSSRVFLVGKVLTLKSFNKESFKRRMQTLWYPKAQVLIFDLEDDCFAFGFNSQAERTTILRGGPWLFNKQFMLVLGEADNMTYLTRVLLVHQDFWVQVKGLPFCYITRQMGKFLGNTLGNYVLTDQTLKDEQFGSILRIRFGWIFVNP